MRWTDTVRAIATRGVTTVVECGPGKVLSGLAKRIDDTLVTHALNDGDAIVATRQALG